METEKVHAILEKTIGNYKVSYKQLWNNLPDDYKSGLLKGIVAFEIIVTDLQDKKKLGQNKTKNEQQNTKVTNGKTEVYDQVEIQKYFSFYDKLKLVLPDITNKAFHIQHGHKFESIKN